MTFREFNMKIMQDDILGKLLPLELKRTYPRLTLENGKLCAAFVGFRMVPQQNAAAAYAPAYYLKITYPNKALRSFEVLASGKDAGSAKRMTPAKPEEIRRLSELCDEAFRKFDEQTEDIESVIAEYNALLSNVLEPEQLAVLERFAQV